MVGAGPVIKELLPVLRGPDMPGDDYCPHGAALYPCLRGRM
jgi:hypothetical protein